MTAAAELHNQVGSIGSEQQRSLEIVGVFAVAVAFIGLIGGVLLPALALASLLTAGGLLVGTQIVELRTTQAIAGGAIHLAVLLALTVA